MNIYTTYFANIRHLPESIIPVSIAGKPPEKCAGYWVKTLNKLTDNFTDEYIKINYGIEFPFDSIGKNEIVYIVDYSISPEEMDKLLEITSNVIWIDHHKSAIEKYKNYDKDVKGLRYDGIAGCMLTYCYLFFLLMELKNLNLKW